MSLEGSTPTTEPLGTRDAISAVILPSPQPTSRIRSEPLRSSKARTSWAIAACNDEMREYPAASHSVICGDRDAVIYSPLPFHKNSRAPRAGGARSSDRNSAYVLPPLHPLPRTTTNVIESRPRFNEGRPIPRNRTKVLQAGTIPVTHIVRMNRFNHLTI